MVCEDTLKVKNLPKEWSDAEKEEFLRHFGASKVKVITSKARQKSVVYARFDTKEIAREILFRLHQTYVLQSRLCVEYADQDIGPPRIKKLEESSSNSKEHFKTFINKLNAFNHSVDFYQPPPPHLKYVYPKANRPTINNIGHALAAVPKFYTQVLHLMNKMNLPPPFAVPDPTRQPVAVQPPQPKPPVESKPKTKPPESSSESELESDEDTQRNPEIIPQKRLMPQKKAIKRPKFIKPQAAASKSDRVERTDEVFERTEVHVLRKIELKVEPGALERKLGEKIHETVTGVIGVQGASEGGSKEDAGAKRTVISDEELVNNQIPAKDLDVLPVFKNYHPGAPTCRLYVKNIAKTVELKDLEYIYNRYKGDVNEGQVDNFDIRLMQEGRMKGQAFVTLNSVEMAQRALKQTNAFILKDKPLVVVFARSAPAKK